MQVFVYVVSKFASLSLSAGDSKVKNPDDLSADTMAK